MGLLGPRSAKPGPQMEMKVVLQTQWSSDARVITVVKKNMNYHNVDRQRLTRDIESCA